MRAGHPHTVGANPNTGLHMRAALQHHPGASRPRRPLSERTGALCRLGLAGQLLFAVAFATPGLAQDTTGVRAEGATGVGNVEPGDLIRLKVWREPDLSGDITVDGNGYATVPRLGPTRVSGMSPDSLRSFIVTSYAQYLRDPAVDVMVLPRVTILGAVRQPGVHNVEPTMTIADVLALAGGASPDGKQDQVELRRRGERVAARLTLDARLAETPVRSGDQLVVPERSWLSRNAGLMLGAGSLGISVIYLIFR